MKKKFRVWDATKKVMLTQSDYMSYHHFCFTPDGDVYFNGVHQPQFELLQLVDMEDSKMEIYEGDIVEVKSHYYGDHHEITARGVVVYQHGEFYINTAKHGYIGMFDAVYNYGLVVLGNIYENPELLK